MKKETYYTGILPSRVSTVNKIKSLKVNKNVSMIICRVSHTPETTWEQVIVIRWGGKTEPRWKGKAQNMQVEGRKCQCLNLGWMGKTRGPWYKGTTGWNQGFFSKNFAWRWLHFTCWPHTANEQTSLMKPHNMRLFSYIVIIFYLLLHLLLKVAHLF